jgi:hypothetical protein
VILVVVISDLLDLFTQDPSIDQDETISLIKEITNSIKKTLDNILVSVSFQPPQRQQQHDNKSNANERQCFYSCLSSVCLSIIIARRVLITMLRTNAVEECWRQGKDDLLVSKYYPRFLHLRNVITKYYRTKRFHLDITKYLLRNVS